jgi:ubiquinone/menaquinone biosynthesis C-methylase UbiE
MLMNVVKEYYDEFAEIEWRRLRSSPYRRLEHIVTTHFLEKYLPPKGLILDAGGGPGRYTIQLAKKGYDVILLDLSPKCLELACKQIKRAGVRNKVKQIVEGSITDLKMFNDEQFDAVLCLGPFSHLIEKEQKEKATSEITRVAKKGAPIFISVISLFGVFTTILQRLQNELLDPTHEEMFKSGVHRAHPIPHKGGRGFARVDACFYHPTEVKALFENRGVRTLEMATCEGLSSHLMGPTNKLYKDQKKWAKWMEIMLKTCTDPILLGTGEHFLYVGRK